MVNGQTGLYGLHVLRPVGEDSDGDTDSVTSHCRVEQAQTVWDPPGKTSHVTMQNVQVRVSTRLRCYPYYCHCYVIQFFCAQIPKFSVIDSLLYKFMKKSIRQTVNAESVLNEENILVVLLQGREWTSYRTDQSKRQEPKSSLSSSTSSWVLYVSWSFYWISPRAPGQSGTPGETSEISRLNSVVKNPVQ